MTTDEDYLALQDQIKAGYEGLKSAPNFRNRTAQRQMIGLLAKTFFHTSDEEHPIAVIEAGTGTGKTFGYCLPLIPIAKHHQKTLVIATGTLALQDQLVKHDLPMLAMLTGWNFSVALAKGRRRYVCPAKLLTIAENRDTALEMMMFEPDIKSETKPEIKQNHHLPRLAHSLLTALDQGWNGDFDQLDASLLMDEEGHTAELAEQLADGSVQWAITTDTAGCLNRRCAQFDACPYMKAKTELMRSDLVVTNHAMLIADLKLGGGAILPAPTRCFHIIDEGHRLPAEVLTHNASGHLLQGSQTWLDGLMKLSHTGISLGDDTYRQQVTGYHQDLTRLAQALKDRLQELYAQLARSSTFHPPVLEAVAEISATSTTSATTEKHAPHVSQRNLSQRKKNLPMPHITRFEHGLLPDWLTTSGREIHDTALGLMNSIGRLYDLTSDAYLRTPQEALTKQLADLGFFKDRTSNLLTTWVLLLDERRILPHAKWIEYRQKGETIDFMVSASPTEAKSFLQAELWSKSSGVTITSATLTALGSFDYFFNQCGIVPEQAVYAQLLSPFDYQKATLVIPDLVEPSHPNHTQAMIDWALTHLNPHEASLMLFTSQQQMNQVAEGLAGRFVIYKQGQQAKHQLIAEHKQRVDSGKGSVLMGLDSFGEGLNLPGNYCRHLVIAKLPFPVPSSPVEQAQAEYLETTGKRAFNELSLPLTSAKLTQWVGRLIRTEEDEGQVSILDSRLLRKSYAKQMLANLPPFRRVMPS